MDYKYGRDSFNGKLLNLLIKKLTENNDIFNNFINMSEDHVELCADQFKRINEIPLAEMFDSEKEFYNYIQNIQQNFKTKCIQQTLEEKEQKAFLKFNSFLLLNMSSVDDSLISAYTYNYIYKNKVHSVEELLILLKNFVQYINETYNMNLKLGIYDFKNGIVAAGVEPTSSTVTFNKRVFDRLKNSKNIKDDTYEKFITHLSCILLHEVRHKLQFRDINNEVIQQELQLIDHNYKFYMKYHNYFYIEQDADNFALENINYFLKGIVDDKIVNKYKKSFKKILIPFVQKSFDEKKQEMYEKLVEDEEIPSKKM